MGKRLDEIAARHHPIRQATSLLFCASCYDQYDDMQVWPCDAALLLMHIARRENIREPGTDHGQSGARS